MSESKPFDRSLPSLTATNFQDEMADFLGLPPTNTRFQTMSIRWINNVLREIQRKDPRNRRTMVHNAAFTIKADQEIYDVRDATDGSPPGFGWTDCFEVSAMIIPETDNRPIELISQRQFRERAYQTGHSGPVDSVVLIDQFRIRVVPNPSSDYEGVAEYYQNFPDVDSQSVEYVDWPRAWDSCLRDGIEYHAAKWQFTQQPSIWIPLRKLYQEALEEIKMQEVTTDRRPQKPVVSRHLRSQRLIPHDNSTDLRRSGW